MFTSRHFLSSEQMQTNQGENPKRIAELDIFRGLAFTGMVVHHIIFFLQWEHVLPPGSAQQTLSVLGLVVRVIFISLVGASSWLWFLKYTMNSETAEANSATALGSVLQPTVSRSLKVAVAAVTISLMSMIFVPAYAVQFGVLHLIAVSVILVVPFLWIPRFSLCIGVVSIGIGYLARSFWSVPSELSWLAWSNTADPALDYFPILPWFGYVLLGLGLASLIYGKEPKSLLSAKAQQAIPGSNVFSWLGQNALMLYVVHLPVMVVVVKTLIFFFERIF